MLPEYFAFISTLIASLGSIYYLYLTIKGKVQPNKITFFFWGLFPMIAFFAQSEQDVSSVIWITFAMGFLPFLILLAAYFNPGAYWAIKPRDYYLAAIAVVSMLLWYVTENANLAIIFALIADVFASLPTILKAYNAPHSEDWKPYAINSVGFLVGVLAIQNWVFAEYSFVLYFFLLTTFLAALIYYRQQSILE